MSENFLSRWSRRKSQAAKDETAVDEHDAFAPPESMSVGEVPAEPLPAAVEPLPLPPIESLTPESDFAPFLREDVTPEMRNQAMKKLFADPHYNVMDGLDTYIDDYSKPDPLPADMLRKLYQAKSLFLFDEVEEDGAQGATEKLAEIAAAQAALSPDEKAPKPKVQERIPASSPEDGENDVARRID